VKNILSSLYNVYHPCDCNGCGIKLIDFAKSMVNNVGYITNCKINQCGKFGPTTITRYFVTLLCSQLVTPTWRQLPFSLPSDLKHYTQHYWYCSCNTCYRNGTTVHKYLNSVQQELCANQWLLILNIQLGRSTNNLQANRPTVIQKTIHTLWIQTYYGDI